MPLVFQTLINRADLTANPDVTYVFGDNYVRTGMGGQAAEMRGEPNAYGIRTKWRPGYSYTDFFHDEQILEVSELWKEDFKPLFTRLSAGKIIVLPTSFVGSGLAEITAARTPKLLSALTKLFSDLKHLDEVMGAFIK